MTGTAPLVTGFACAVCGATVPIDQFAPWRCPNASTTDRHHVLQVVRRDAPFTPSDDPHPFVAHDRELAWAAFAHAHGMDGAARAGFVRELDRAVAAVAGTGFVVTPLARADALSDALGFSASAGVWVKDETSNVGGSHKARHLFTILLHLRAAEALGVAPWSSPADRPSLAISSCGNAAIAASTLAASVRWPISVFVPPWASRAVVDTLTGLGATIVECPRRDADPPGDPCIHRFREAVAGGAIPFGVQGPENALCLDGGRVLPWEILGVLGRRFDRWFVQVGGGAFAAGFADAAAVAGARPALHAVQTEGCAPLARAWGRLGSIAGGRSNPGPHWDQAMWPWEAEPASLADGILDDETYDWIPVVRGMVDSDGSPVVAAEADVVGAHHLARSTTSIPVSPTGSAGLAGVLAIRGEIGDDDRVVVVFSGVAR